jgi:hypothetical protein
VIWDFKKKLKNLNKVIMKIITIFIPKDFSETKRQNLYKDLEDGIKAFYVSYFPEVNYLKLQKASRSYRGRVALPCL